jgi:hypothetical protein
MVPDLGLWNVFGGRFLEARLRAVERFTSLRKQSTCIRNGLYNMCVYGDPAFFCACSRMAQVETQPLGGCFAIRHGRVVGLQCCAATVRHRI